MCRKTYVKTILNYLAVNNPSNSQNAISFRAQNYIFAHSQRIKRASVIKTKKKEETRKKAGEERRKKVFYLEFRKRTDENVRRRMENVTKPKSYRERCCLFYRVNIFIPRQNNFGACVVERKNVIHSC